MSQENTEYNKDTDASLIEAAAGGDETIVRLLLEKGANTEAQDGDGNTPLIEAARSGHKAVVSLLLEHGANSDVTNLEGYTAYDCAKKTSIWDLLRSY